MRLRHLLIAPLALGLALLLPNNAWARTPEAQSHTSVATYVVADGDWLVKIAARQCGNTARWAAIYELNKATIGANPNLIRAGQRLLMPSGCNGGGLAAPTPRTATTSSGWVAPLSPMPGCVSGWGAPRVGHTHKGVDLPRPAGTPIRAIHSGRVVVNKWSSGAGWYVMVDHGTYQSVSMHQRVRSPLPVGRTVAAGQQIGVVGSTGDSTGPHLHLEIHVGAWHPTNPAPFLRARGIPVRGC